MNYFGARGNIHRLATNERGIIARYSDQRLLTIHALFRLAASVDVNEVGDVGNRGNRRAPFLFFFLFIFLFLENADLWSECRHGWLQATNDDTD